MTQNRRRVNWGGVHGHSVAGSMTGRKNGIPHKKNWKYGGSKTFMYFLV